MLSSQASSSYPIKLKENLSASQAQEHDPEHIESVSVVSVSNRRHHRKKLPLGIALPIVLLVLTLMLVTVVTVSKQGIGSLQKAKLEQFRLQAMFAAEAGASDAMRRLVETPTFNGSITPGTLSTGAEYEATVYNNFAGSGPITAPNGAVVPKGYSYILGEGQVGRLERRVGLLVAQGSATALGLVVGVGGNADFTGNKSVAGSVKASGDIVSHGNSNFAPSAGSGRLLAAGNIQTHGNTRVDDSQDVRARGSVSSSPAIRGALVVQSGDTTVDTLPFIADGRTTNSLNTGEQGLVLPNPDQTVIKATIVDHSLDPVPGQWDGPLDTAGKVHYFPLGVDFGSGTNITGNGTILVDHGNSINFQGNVNVDANLVALRDDPTTATGNPSITFHGNADVHGLIYAHEDVEVHGNFDLKGLVIAYRSGGGDLITHGNTSIFADSRVLSNIPGFDSWASGFGGVGGVPSGSGPLSVYSWEKL